MRDGLALFNMTGYPIS